MHPTECRYRVSSPRAESVDTPAKPQDKISLSFRQEARGEEDRLQTTRVAATVVLYLHVWQPQRYCTYKRNIKVRAGCSSHSGTVPTNVTLRYCTYKRDIKVLYLQT